MAYVSFELDIHYSAKHIRTQLKLYAEEHYDELLVFAKKYLIHRKMNLRQYLNTKLLQPNFADELCLILISQRYNVHTAVLTDGNGYWCTTCFKVLEECNLVFLGMQNKLGTLTFLLTRWCTDNHKPVIPVNPSMFKEELKSSVQENECKKRATSGSLQISPNFLKKTNQED